MTLDDGGSAPPRSRLGYVAGLDGLRACAVLAVIVSHAALWPGDGGWLGVYVFFGLSGFLITSLLLDEWATTGRIGLTAFYIRRFLRLLPPLAAFVAIAGGGFWLFGSDANREEVRSALPWVATYLANWGELDHLRFGPLGHLWSLAVEEQFYIVWAPIALVVLRTRRGAQNLLAVALIGVVLGSVARLYPVLLGDNPRVSYATDLQCDAILLGCAAAVLVHQGRLRLAQSWQRWVGPAGALVLLALLAHESRPGGVYGLELLTLAVALATAAVVVAIVQRPDTALASALSCKPLVWLGRRSYAIYLWHFPFTWVLVDEYGSAPVPAFILSLGGSVGLAHLSMLLLEGPLQHVRARFAYRATRTVDPSVLLTTS